VASGRRAIIRQHELLLNLERDGQDTGEARRLLATFDDLQKLHVADRDRLPKNLPKALHKAASVSLSHKERRKGNVNRNGSSVSSPRGGESLRSRFGLPERAGMSPKATNFQRK
jgi:hypothetical protein